MTNELHQLAGPYALDALDVEEQAEFERHLETCESCRHEVAEFRETSALIAEIEASEPPEGLRHRVLADIAGTRQLPPVLPDRVIDLAEQRRRRVPRQRVLAAVAAAVVVVVGIIGVGQLGNPGGDEFALLLDAPDAKVTTLEGEAGGGNLQIVWSAEQDRAAVIGTGLDDPGEGRAYALWFLLDEGVAPAGLFVPSDGQVRALLSLDDLDTGGWGITIEPDSGSDQPTTDVIFSGTV